MEKTDITIIGAGVVGLAIAAEISRPDLKIFILEKIMPMERASVPGTVRSFMRAFTIRETR